MNSKLVCYHQSMLLNTRAQFGLNMCKAWWNTPSLPVWRLRPQIRDSGFTDEPSCVSQTRETRFVHIYLVIQMWWWLDITCRGRSHTTPNGGKSNMAEISYMEASELGTTRRIRGKWNYCKCTACLTWWRSRAWVVTINKKKAETKSHKKYEVFCGFCRWSSTEKEENIQFQWRDQTALVLGPWWTHFPSLRNFINFLSYSIIMEHALHFSKDFFLRHYCKYNLPRTNLFPGSQRGFFWYWGTASAFHAHKNTNKLFTGISFLFHVFFQTCFSVCWLL